MSATAEFSDARWRASPNFGPRRNGLRPNILLLHYTGMATGKAAEDWLCNAGSEVSSHYLVHEDGSVVQMVREADRAWHAGKASWKGEADINSRSIGIEIVNEGHEGGLPAFPDPQIAALVRLCRDIASRHAIAPERVLGHSDVAPGRKIDPGERFPWAALAAEGVGHFVEPAAVRPGAALGKGDSGADVARLQEMLSDYGYAVSVDGRYDAHTALVVEAFQRHFRPSRVDGAADASTRETLALLLETLPVPSARGD